VGEALAILKYANKKGGPLVAKVVASAAANAEHNFDMDKDALIVSEIFVDEGPRLKRTQPRAHGKADLRVHRMSHVTVVVRERGV
jgi:large subunit ribosomal protein L22